MVTLAQMINREVHCCVSSLISTLAQGYGGFENATLARAKSRPDIAALGDLVEQAFELSSPIPDYEEAAIQEGWTGPHTDEFGATYFENKTESDQNQTWAAKDWESLCRDFEIEPHDRDVYEHWAVSGWLAEKLIAQGEKVDTDFAAMNVWARTTTGQGIASDSCIENIYADLVRP